MIETAQFCLWVNRASSTGRARCSTWKAGEWLTSFQIKPLIFSMASETSIKILSEADLDSCLFCKTFSQRKDTYQWGIFLSGYVHTSIEKHTAVYMTNWGHVWIHLNNHSFSPSHEVMTDLTSLDPSKRPFHCIDLINHVTANYRAL